MALLEVIATDPKHVISLIAAYWDLPLDISALEDQDEPISRRTDRSKPGPQVS